jgi:23S rRNA (guanosine2251-2'-O)-methyltransferase
LVTERGPEADWAGQAPISTVSAAEISALCGSDDHQGAAAEVEDYRYAAEQDLLSIPNAFLVVLDEIQDPRNLGAICRVAEAAGVDGVVIPRHRSAEVTATVCKASAGAVEHLRVARTRNVADFLEAAGKAGLWRHGAAAEGADRWDEVDWTGPVVLVMGSEGKGLRPRVAGSCDRLVALPLEGKVDSLNVATAASALIYEAIRQRTS